MKIQIDKATVEQALSAVVAASEELKSLKLNLARDLLYAALTAAPTEPVAWMYPIITEDGEGSYAVRRYCPDVAGMQPLFTAPQPQREPLTNGEIYTAYIEATNQTLRPQDERLALAFARAIEKAHGIGVAK